MVKFRHTYDPQDMGLIEFHYNELARQCGIRVPDFKLINGKYFTTRRFDISQDGDVCIQSQPEGCLTFHYPTQFSIIATYWP